MNLSKIHLLLITLLTLSYNFHSLWILYDISIIFLITKFVTGKIHIRRKNFFFIICVILLSFFFFSVYINDGYIQSILSFWDTTKHLIYFSIVTTYFIELDRAEKMFFIKKQHKVLFFLFLLQIPVIAYQLLQKYHFDDIAGTFGYGASHSIAYLSISFLISSIILNKNYLKIILYSIIAFSLNLAGENYGFFILFIIVPIIYYAKNSKSRIPEFVFIIISILSFSFVMSLEEYQLIKKRFSNLYETESFVPAKEIKAERNIMYQFALYKGKYLGSGIGAYSDVYGFEGYKKNEIGDIQINISEFSHLISEWGIIGTTFVLMSFAFQIYIYSVGRFVFLTSTFLFILSIMYNRALMDERIFIYLMTSILLLNFDIQKFSILKN